MENIPTLEDIQQTHHRIRPFIHQTPVMSSELINALAGCSIYFKCENFQKTGSFKMRGAHNAVLSLPSTKISQGVATHSSGNHAQALAKAAANMGCKAHIVMPESAPDVKVNAVKDYGAEIYFCASSQQDREQTLKSVLKDTGATFIHPYDNYDIIAGQATVALELIEEIPDLNILITPVGGGGLLSGTCLTSSYLLPERAHSFAAPSRRCRPAFAAGASDTPARRNLQSSPGTAGKPQGAAIYNHGCA